MGIRLILGLFPSDVSRSLPRASAGKVQANPHRLCSQVPILALFSIVVFSTIALAGGDNSTFPEGEGFPEKKLNKGEYREDLDWLDKASTFLVRTPHKARVEYGSGRVVTLYACKGVSVERDGSLVVRLPSSSRVIAVRLAGIQETPIEGLTREESYGWKSGPLLDRTNSRFKPVPLRAIELHSLWLHFINHDLWLEFDGDLKPATKRPPVWLYDVERDAHGEHTDPVSLNRKQLIHGFATVTREPCRNRDVLQKDQDWAAKKIKGLWSEARWRDQETRGFDFLISAAAGKRQAQELHRRHPRLDF